LSKNLKIKKIVQLAFFYFKKSVFDSFDNFVVDSSNGFLCQIGRFFHSIFKIITCFSKKTQKI